MINADIYKHLFDREYMSGVEREKSRIKATGEVFTPTHLVEEILDKMDQELFKDPTKTFLDPSCGDGQFLASVLYRKLQNDIDFETVLSTIYGVDLMPDNVEETRTRLLCGREDLQHVVNRNIVCHDGLTYDYSFNGTNKTDAELHFDKWFD
jgi:type I restriction-modification system DNA methylase subunit